MAVVLGCLFIAGGLLAVVGAVLGWATPSHPKGRAAGNCVLAGWVLLFGLSGLSRLLSPERSAGFGCGALFWFLLLVVGTGLVYWTSDSWVSNPRP